MSAPRDLRVSHLKDGVVVVSWQRDAPLTPLSPAEHEVLTLAAGGATNAEIAKRRGTSVRTVANLLARAYRKLGIGSRAAAAARVAGTQRPRP